MEGPSLFPSSSEEVKNEISHIFDCVICTEVPTNPVATSCGHVFCWGCMYKWGIQNGPKPCPVCRKGDFKTLPLGKATEGGASGIPKRPHKLPSMIVPSKKRDRDDREDTRDLKRMNTNMDQMLRKLRLRKFKEVFHRVAASTDREVKTRNQANQSVARLRLRLHEKEEHEEELEEEEEE